LYCLECSQMVHTIIQIKKEFISPYEAADRRSNS
jgi:hypothetical protein